jgi:hypothetical protein
VSALAVYSVLAFFWLSGVALIVALCVAAKRGDRRLRAYVTSLREPEQPVEELELLWKLPPRERSIPWR